MLEHSAPASAAAQEQAMALAPLSVNPQGNSVPFRSITNGTTFQSLFRQKEIDSIACAALRCGDR